MYTTDWVNLTDEDPETKTSSFLQKFAWKTKDPNPEDEETYGTLVVWIQEDPNDGIKRYAYRNTQRKIFEALKEEAYHGYQPGSVFNRKVSNNSEIEEAESLLPDQSSD